MVWLRQKTYLTKVLRWVFLGCLVFGLSDAVWGEPFRDPKLSPSMPPLRVGDVILIELRCYACGVISATTGSPFNHSGLVLEFSKDGEPMVAQSISQVETITLAAFLAQAKRNSTIMVRRSTELDDIYSKNLGGFKNRTLRMKAHFEATYRGQLFDQDYLWDNRDAAGKELLYCSELVQKTLNHVLKHPLPPVAMDFSNHWDFWQKYFRGVPPQGLPGNSPGSLAASSLLSTMWEGASL